MNNKEYGGNHPSKGRRRRHKIFIAVAFILMAVVFMSNTAFAAEKTPRYQVVAGGEDKAYLLDTTTGFTWILTYRTMATGREPVAIPYKFIKISPANQRDFIVETNNGISLPSN
ncbi:MAG: hypothetical protein CVU71_04465 [Deltaproteobacteria bacterium HGW-Deltaproteobacteria-6]|jgi:hypothetical protein|nr:MAG: hypothetical protein CVU71_04465 [Deltaproteobacteria bacterium HGW-Deltaproteobacteria-6]